MPTLHRLAPILALLAAAACGGSEPVAPHITSRTPPPADSDSIVPPTPVPAKLEVITGADQRGNALEPLGEDIIILVLDSAGNAMPDVMVTVAVLDGNGIAAAQGPASDSLGAVHVYWALGPRTGVQHLRATVADVPSVQTTITATARPQLLASLQGSILVLLNQETSAVRQLFAQWVAIYPAWSPDGRRIAFIGRPDNSVNLNNRVYVMNADGSGVTPITTITDSTSDLDVDWSPDGKHLVFTRVIGSASRIFMMDPDGKNMVQLTNMESEMPRWSPDGKRIALSVRTGTNRFFEIAIMNADGSDIRTLTNNNTDDLGPDWAPDGKRLVYTGWREGNPRLFVINADGTGDRLLTTSPADNVYDDQPAWSHDGTLIAFSRGVLDPGATSDSSALYTIRPDGTGLAVVWPGPQSMFGPRWRP